MLTTESITATVIGHVRQPVADADIPRRRRELVATIEILDRYAPALAGIEAWSHLFVLFWMHRIVPGQGPLTVHPRGRTDLPEVGTFATRGRDRPNPIGLAVVELVGREGPRLTVRRLDAFDGTPVLDIKPYDPYDALTDLRVPDWWRAMTAGR
jgi:tRNA-Thr(GGU) m(6)t(6)A37 methyltransferase TsaA